MQRDHDDPEPEADRQPGSEHGGAPDDRPAADAAGAPRRDRAPDLLLEREEEPRREHEDRDPQRVQGRVVSFAQGAERQDLEEVRRHARDEQTGTDDVGALGDGAAGGLDQPLGALGH